MFFMFYLYIQQHTVYSYASSFFEVKVTRGGANHTPAYSTEVKNA